MWGHNFLLSREVPNYPEISSWALVGAPYKGRLTLFHAYLATPKIKKGAPGILLIHGGGGHSFLEWAKKYQEEGYYALTLDWGGFFPTGLDAGKNELDERWKRSLPLWLLGSNYTILPPFSEDFAKMKLEEGWLYQATQASLHAFSFLKQQEGIDQERIGVFGISWGSVITSILIGLCQDFAFAINGYGGGFLGASRGWISSSFNYEKIDPFYQAERNLSKYQKPILYVGGDNDNFFDPYSLSQSYLANQNPHSNFALKHHFPHSHGHAYNALEVKYFLASLSSSDYLLPRVPTFPKDGEFAFSLERKERAYIFKSASLYYLLEEMDYSKKQGFVSTWYNFPLLYENGVLKGKMPDKYAYAYLSLVYHVGEEEIVVASPLQKRT